MASQGAQKAQSIWSLRRLRRREAKARLDSGSRRVAAIPPPPGLHLLRPVPPARVEAAETAPPASFSSLQSWDDRADHLLQKQELRAERGVTTVTVCAGVPAPVRPHAVSDARLRALDRKIDTALAGIRHLACRPDASDCRSAVADLQSHCRDGFERVLAVMLERRTWSDSPDCQAAVVGLQGSCAAGFDRLAPLVSDGYDRLRGETSDSINEAVRLIEQHIHTTTDQICDFFDVKLTDDEASDGGYSAGPPQVSAAGRGKQGGRASKALRYLPGT